MNKALKLHVNRFNYNSAEEEGGNRLAYLIASDELQGMIGRYFSGRPGQQEFSAVAPSEEASHRSETLESHGENAERVRQEYQMK